MTADQAQQIVWKLRKLYAPIARELGGKVCAARLASIYNFALTSRMFRGESGLIIYHDAYNVYFEEIVIGPDTVWLEEDFLFIRTQKPLRYRQSIQDYIRQNFIHQPFIYGERYND
jgi:hypothetical protein